MRNYQMFKKSEMELAEAVNKSTQAIKEKYDRIKDLELYYIPDTWLNDREKSILMEEQRYRLNQQQQQNAYREAGYYHVAHPQQTK